jgi:lysophospholipase L1-like esterase
VGRLLGAALLALAAAGGAAADCGGHAAPLSAAEALPAFTDGPVKVLAIGSSSTQGVGASGRDASYPATLERLLNGRLGPQAAQVVNAGLGGERADATLRRLREAVRATDYDLVIWQVGVNDALAPTVDESAFVERLNAGIDAVRASGAALLLLDQQWFPRIDGDARYARFVSVLRETAAARAAPVLSRWSMMTAMRAAEPALAEAMLSADRFHMNDRGYACLAEQIAQKLLAPAPTLHPGAARS